MPVIQPLLRPAAIFARAAWILAALVLGALIPATPALAACTVSSDTISLGSVGSYTVAESTVSNSGASGLSCTAAFTLITTLYVKVKIESSTFTLTGPGGQTIPFAVAKTSGGAALSVGSEADYTTTALLSGLFSGPSNSIPLYVSTTMTSGLAAGTYTGTINLRWYYSVCATAVAACLTYSESPGINRANLALGGSTWGTGTLSTATITLIVLPDCKITAPDIAFGTAPLVGSFSPVTRTISVRCSKGSSYTVGLGDGANFSGSRRMRQGTTSNYLAYEIYRGITSSTGRWGSAVAGERRDSATADSNAGVYDTTSLQGFTYSAAVNTAQATPAAGTYTDTVIVDIVFN